MTIGFSLYWPKDMHKDYANHATFFVEKITKCASKMFGKELDEYISSNVEKLKYPSKDIFINTVIDSHPKKHTFREDPSDRWKPGMKIHPVIHNRTKDRYQFAPTMVCKSIQKVEIIYSDEALCEFIGSEPVIEIDGKPLNLDQMERLAINDGFESTHHFCQWFNKDWKGKIIHWTDLKY